MFPASGGVHPPSLVWSEATDFWQDFHTWPYAMVVSPRSCEYFDLHSCRICGLLTFWAFRICTLIDLCLSLAICVYIYLSWQPCLTLLTPHILFHVSYLILSYLTFSQLSYLSFLLLNLSLSFLSYLLSTYMSIYYPSTIYLTTYHLPPYCMPPPMYMCVVPQFPSHPFDRIIVPNNQNHQQSEPIQSQTWHRRKTWRLVELPFKILYVQISRSQNNFPGKKPLFLKMELKFSCFFFPAHFCHEETC